MGDKTYQVLVDGDQRGPVDESWICVRLTSGELSPKVLVWSEGMADWAPAESLEQFAGLAPNPAAAPPAPPPVAPPPAAPAPIPPVTAPPPSAANDDRTVTVDPRPAARPDALAASQRPGLAVERVRSVAIDTRLAKDAPDPKRTGWNRRERIVAAVVIGSTLLLTVVLVVPWFKKRVLGTCDEVYDECVERCDKTFETYADMQQCVGPCEDDRRQCVAKERPGAKLK